MADISDEIAAALPEIMAPTREVSFIQGICNRFPKATTTDVMRGLMKASQAALEPYDIELPERLEPQSRTEHIACLMLIPQALALDDILVPVMEMVQFVSMAVEGALLEEFLHGNYLATQVLLVLRGERSEDPRAYRLAGRSN